MTHSYRGASIDEASPGALCLPFLPRRALSWSLSPMMARKFGERDPPPSSPTQDSASGSRQRPNLLPLTTHMSIPIPLLRQTPTREETQQEGRVLLSSFIGEQVEEEGESIDVDGMGNAADAIYSQTIDREAGDSYESRTQALEMNPEFLRLGRELRSLADQFSRSPERRRVQREAERLNINELGRDNLFALMTELFRDGFSRERLVTFFFFCSDLILRALRQSVRELRWQVVAWVWEFFRDRVCAWVCERGGWEAVLTNYLPKLAVTAAGFAVAALAVVCIWKMVRSP